MAATGELPNLPGSSPHPGVDRKPPANAQAGLPGALDGTPTAGVRGLSRSDDGATRHLKAADSPVQTISFEWASLSRTGDDATQRLQQAAVHEPVSTGLSFGPASQSPVPATGAISAVHRVEQTVSFVAMLREHTLPEAIARGALPPGVVAHLKAAGYAVADGHLTEIATGRTLSTAETREFGTGLAEDAALTLAEDYHALQRDEAIHLQALSGSERATYLNVRASLDRLLTAGQPVTVSDAVIQAFLAERGRSKPVAVIADVHPSPANRPAPSNALIDFDLATMLRWRDQGMAEGEFNQLSAANQQCLLPFLQCSPAGLLGLALSDQDLRTICNAVDLVQQPRSEAARVLVADLDEVLADITACQAFGIPEGLAAENQTLSTLIQHLAGPDVKALRAGKTAIKHGRPGPHKGGAAHGPAQPLKPVHAVTPARPAQDPQVAARTTTAKTVQNAYAQYGGAQRWGTRLTAERLTQQVRSQRIHDEARSTSEAYADSVMADGRAKAAERRGEAPIVVRTVVGSPSPATDALGTSDPTGDVVP